MEWYEEIEFDENPFKQESKLIGFEDVVNELNYAIVSGSMIFIEGERGSGKTKLLKEAIRKFGGHGKIIYVNGRELHTELNVERLLKNRHGVLGRVFNQKPKGMILLLDDVEHISKRNCERIKYYFDQNYLRSVVFASKSLADAGLSDSVKQRLWKVLRLHELTNYEAVQLVRTKVGNDMLNDRAIKEIFRLSDRNPKKFLENCEKVCKVAAKNKSLTEEDVQAILTEQQTEVMVVD